MYNTVDAARRDFNTITESEQGFYEFINALDQAFNKHYEGSTSDYIVTSFNMQSNTKVVEIDGPEFPSMLLGRVEHELQKQLGEWIIIRKKIS